jgi:hypothetical protein
MADKSEPKQAVSKDAPSTPSNAATLPTTAPAPPAPAAPVTSPAPPTTPATPVKGGKILLPLQLTVKAVSRTDKNIEVRCVITDGLDQSVQSLSLAVDGRLTNAEVETILQEAISQLATKLYQADKTAFVPDTAPLGDLVGFTCKGSVAR